MTENALDLIRVEAQEKFRVVRQESRAGVEFREAENGTGSRFVVVVSDLGPVGTVACGNRRLVTLLWPWQTAWAMDAFGGVYESYVSEHFAPPGDSRIKSPGDRIGICMTIAHALGREYIGA